MRLPRGASFCAASGPRAIAAVVKEAARSAMAEAPDARLSIGICSACFVCPPSLTLILTFTPGAQNEKEGITEVGVARV